MRSTIVVRLLTIAVAAIAAVVVTETEQRPVGAAFPGANAKIAFTSDRAGLAEIFHMNPNGSGQVNLSNMAASAELRPSYSPYGAKIAFYSSASGSDQIYTMNADGSGVSAALTIAGSNDTPAHCGTMIAFVSNRDSNAEVYTMNADGSSQTNRSMNAATDSQPAWSPDCTMIAFMSVRDGNQEIYTMTATGGSQINRTMNGGVDFYPDWQPLVYIGGVAELPDIARKPIEARDSPGSEMAWSIAVGGGAVILLFAAAYAMKREQPG